jgi:pimeloyl-ACP methyl ester carboxylesterase
MTLPRDGALEVRGLKLHYLEWGDPGGAPLVLVHGFLDHARSWERFVAALEKASAAPRRIIAPDCRGHGDSGRVGVGGYYHFPDYIWDLNSIVESLQLSRFDLVGHSMGGTISFIYAGTFPARVQKLVLVEGIGPLPAEFSDAPPRMERWITEVKLLPHRKIVEYASLEIAADRLRRKNPRLEPSLALELARTGMRRIDNGSWVWKFDPLHRTAAPQPFYSGQAIEYFRRIECPVLIINGAESRMTPRPDIERRLEAIRDRRVAEVENAAHMIHHDNPERLAELVSGFIDGD